MTTTATRRSARLSSRANTQFPQEAIPPLPASKLRQTKRKRKAGAEDEAAQPATPPPPKKRAQRKEVLPPVTPLPASVKLSSEVRGSEIKSITKSVNRLADPRLTNATLLSPETSRLVASRDVESVSPSKAPAIKSTTDTLLREACSHLIKMDARMKPLIDKYHCNVFSPEGLAEAVDPFESISSGIISQQVSGAAAKSIKAKFVALFDENHTGLKFPVPSEVAACSIERLRTAGLSQRKAEYIQGLAEKFANGELSAQMLHDAPYEELVEKLIAVRGLGKWSVEMFAFFGLKRMDVFSLGDLGVQRGCAAFVGRDISKLKAKGGGKWKYMSEKDMVELSDKFTPYRSLFMWYMWRVEPTDVSTME